MIAGLRHRAALAAKGVLFGRRGEPYRIMGHTLRYMPETRPVRLRYAHSKNAVARYDALLMQLLASTLKEGDTAIDIGAHCGQYSILMAAMCGHTGRVVAFEPDPYARKTLLANLGLNPQLKLPVVEPLAVSERNGKALLYSRGGNSQSSLARSGVEFSDTDSSEEIPVDVVSLDSYLLDNRVDEPRWIKIDVEGAEISVLRGARRILASNAGIVCELHPYAWKEFGTDFSELKQLAAAAGRRIRFLDQESEIGDDASYGAIVLERP